MVSAQAVLSARVDARHEKSSDDKIGSEFLAWRQTGYSDRNIINMSTFSKYEHLLLGITQFDCNAKKLKHRQ